MLDLAPYGPVSAMPAVRVAAARLGARPGQRNVLVRVVLRHLERTLTDQEANSLRDRIYAAIHQGTRHQWAVAQRPRGRDARARAGAGRRP
jgi:phenylalanyl-tRNA synthetase alpha chain